MRHNIPCAVCGKKFNSNRHNARFCSEACKKANKEHLNKMRSPKYRAEYKQQSEAQN